MMNAEKNSKTSSKKILFLTSYPFDTAPGQRFRYEQYLKILEQRVFEYSYASFMDDATWDILYKKGMLLRKTWGILMGFLRRFILLFTMSKYDFIFIFREATPLGPPVIEWLIAKVLGKKIIYDFDDAIWLPNTSKNNKIIAGIKWHSKVAKICGWSHKVSCGNAYLADYASQFNPMVVINPTTIDTVNYHNRVKDQHTQGLTIGWTGTHTTIQYLDFIVPILQRLEQRYDFTFMVISNLEPDFKLRSLKFVKWSKDTEVDDLLRFNVGIMPLTDDAWARGKCGFKALQYMSLSIPAIVSPVGVNTEIVDHHVNGMICDSSEEWESALEAFMKDAELRVKMGVAARQKVTDRYSVLSNTQNFLGLFEG